MDKVNSLFQDICTDKRHVNPRTLNHVIELAVEIAREGREGRKVGTIFLVGDTENTIKRSRCLILDPLKGHPPASKKISDPNMRETLKELAQLDGSFIISDDGIVLSAARYINASFEGINLPLGLGGRHLAGASISRETGCVAIVVSESSIVRIIDDGEIVSEIIPELWMLKDTSLHMKGPLKHRTKDNVRVISRK